MKAEINNKNKVRFFAQYWGQKVFMNPILSITPVSNIFVFEYDNPEDIEQEYLLLKPLSSISDEDAIAVIGPSECYSRINNLSSHLYGMSPSGIFIDSITSNGDSYHISSYEQDYLRSKGYLLPWMGLSPEEIIESGWAKYKE